ncbi:MAG: hypothetical protein IT579_13595 [Verrucomicrobia subdivision 3 bacterium]|nr:hypothetical protein [Limisphaerales bacterium]
MNTVNPQSVASKIKALRESSAVADVEMFSRQAWFIQAADLRPGGLPAFVKQLISAAPEHFQFSAMIEAGRPEDSGRYSLRQCLGIWKTLTFNKKTVANQLMRPEATGPSGDDTRDFEDLLAFFVDRKTTVEDATGDKPQAMALRNALARFNLDYLKLECQQIAQSKLPSLLSDICQHESTHLAGTSYCPALPALLTEQIVRHATATRVQLADTVVTKTVFRELEFACSERVPVPIVGESRFGKTQSVKVWCDANPGRARLVTVPDGNREVDFMRAHADAFGIDYNPSTPAPILKDKVEFVLRHSGLMAVYDEAHYLVPSSYHKATPPRRINWVRSKVMDQGVPCAFFATPQSHRQTLEKYVTTTGYRVEQWLGRMAPPVILPDLIPFEQIVAVAKIHFPEIADVLLEELADRSINSEGYLKYIDMAGRRSRFLARERNHAVPTKSDVLDAIEEMMPPAPGPRVVSDCGEAAPLVAERHCNSSASARQFATIEQFSRRGTDTGRLLPAPALVT